MISKLLMVSCKAEEILYAKRGSAKYVCLYANPVPVPAGHLHHRLHALGKGKKPGSKARHPDYCCLAVSYINRVHMALEDPGLFADNFVITIFRGSQLACNRKGSRCQDLL